MKTTVLKPQSLGIKETTEFFDLADEVILAVQNSVENDNKVNFSDITNFVGVPVKLIRAVQGIEKIDDELADLTPEETAVLESRIDKYAGNPRYANLVGHLLLAANEIVALSREKKAAEAAE